MKVVFSRAVRLISAAALLSSMAACSGRVMLKPGEIPAPTVPTKEEHAGAEAFVSTLSNKEGFTPIQSGPELKRVQGVVKRLALVAGFSQNEFPVHVVDAKEQVNAMAVGSASIVVYKKLLAKVKSDDELAVVLSHEMGHILARHSQEEEKKKKRAERVAAVGSIFGVVASVATSVAGFGGASDLAGSLAESTTDLVGYGAFVGKFDREQEYEADHIGLLLMGKAGFNPEIALQFWSRAEEIFGHSSSKLGAFFNTHPSFGDREGALKEALPIAQGYYEDWLANKGKTQLARK